MFDRWLRSTSDICLGCGRCCYDTIPICPTYLAHNVPSFLYTGSPCTSKKCRTTSLLVQFASSGSYVTLFLVQSCPLPARIFFRVSITRAFRKAFARRARGRAMYRAPYISRFAFLLFRAFWRSAQSRRSTASIGFRLFSPRILLAGLL